VGLEVRVDRPDVAPVPLEARLAGVAAVDEARQQVVAEVLQALVPGLLRQLVEQVEHRLGLEDEDLVRDDVALRLVGLVDVLADPPVLDLHHAVAAGVVGLDLVGDHGDVRAGLDVLLHEGAVVELVDRVRAHHDERLGSEFADERRVAPEAVGGPLLEALALVVAEPRLQEQQAAHRAVEVPRPAVGHVVAEGDRVVLLRDPDVLDAAVVAVREREVDELVGPGEGDGGLGAGAGQELEAPAGAAGEDQDQGADAGHARPLPATGVRAIAPGAQRRPRGRRLPAP
jgi:hypothetical protein